MALLKGTKPVNKLPNDARVPVAELIACSKLTPRSIKVSILGVFEVFFFPRHLSAGRASRTINKIFGFTVLSSFSFQNIYEIIILFDFSLTHLGEKFYCIFVTILEPEIYKEM